MPVPIHGITLKTMALSIRSKGGIIEVNSAVEKVKRGLVVPKVAGE